LVWECTQELEEQSGSNKVTLEWIPGHHGIPGNEESNKSNKEGKAIPLQAWTGLEDSRSLRLPDFKTIDI
jgi:ribonuclease HI